MSVETKPVQSCPACGSPEAKSVLRRAGGIAMARCQRCRFTYLERIPPLAFPLVIPAGRLPIVLRGAINEGEWCVVVAGNWRETAQGIGVDSQARVETVRERRGRQA